LRGLRRRAAAGAPRVSEKSAGAGVHRRHQHEPGGERHRSRGPGDAHAAFFERLTQDVQHAAAELGQFVQEQHAAVREGNFSRTRQASAPDQRDVRDRVVRRPEGAVRHQPATGCEQPRDGVNRGHFQRFLERHRRQDARDAPRHHCLSGAGRADEQHVVPAGRADLERAPRQRLAAHVCEVRVGVLLRLRASPRRGLRS
jgi:hypothetical protein